MGSHTVRLEAADGDAALFQRTDLGRHGGHGCAAGLHSSHNGITLGADEAHRTGQACIRAGIVRNHRE